MTGTPEYKAWQQMLQRCTNTSYVQWKKYGPKGVSVCSEWVESFEAFYEHIGRKPGKGYYLDRINTFGNYEPGNVRWATLLEQNQNRRDRRLITINGETKSAQEWAAIFGVSPSVIYHRAERGTLHKITGGTYGAATNG
jgi:hypothetical protein